MGVRLLVSFTVCMVRYLSIFLLSASIIQSVDPSLGTDNHENLLWAIDHGFEYIEVNESTLVEGIALYTPLFIIFMLP
jgi:hypothetical protein